MTDYFKKFRGNEKIVATIQEGIIPNVIPKWIWFFTIGIIWVGTGVVIYIFSWPVFAEIAVGICVLVFSLLFIRFLVCSYLSKIILTNRRIIEYHRDGFFRYSNNEFHYDQILEVYHQIKGISAYIFKVGDLKLELIGGRNSIIWGLVFRPDRIQNLILELQQEYIKHTRSGELTRLFRGNHQNNFSDDNLSKNYLSPVELIDFVRKVMEIEDKKQNFKNEINSKGTDNLESAGITSRSGKEPELPSGFTIKPISSDGL